MNTRTPSFTMANDGVGKTLFEGVSFFADPAVNILFGSPS